MTQPSPTPTPQSTPQALQNTHPTAVQRSQEAPIPIQSVSTNAQRDIYVVARDSVITSPLAVLITLIVSGIGLALLFQRLTKNVTPLLTKYVEAQVKFLENAGDQIESTNETVDEMQDKADKHYSDSSLHSVLVIEKLNRIETDVKDLKQTIVNNFK